MAKRITAVQRRTLIDVKAQVKRAFTEKTQRSLIELRLEGIGDEDIAHEVGASRESVRKWRKGETPSREKAERVRQVYEKIMFLKAAGLSYENVKQQRITLDQAYEQHQFLQAAEAAAK